MPLVEHVDELPSWVPEGARYLVGFCMNDAAASPSKSLSAGRKKLASMGRHFEGWCEARRQRVAEQVERIKHWQIFELGYEDTGTFNPEATWFIDPPYQKAGIHYKCSSKQIDYTHLGEWCRQRRGQAIVCENEGADWLPFREFATIKAAPAMSADGMRKASVSHEVIWTNE